MTNNFTFKALLPLLKLQDGLLLSMGPLQFRETSHGVAIDMSGEIADTFVQPMIVDGVYLLYFLAAFPHGQLERSHLPTDPFRKIIFEEKNAHGENRFFLENLDLYHAKALGYLLDEVYHESGERRPLLRALRFFVDRYVHPFGDALHQVSDPEDITYLELAFESLFDLEGANQVPYLKQQIRMLLNLKFGRPLELMWKCIEGFYVQLSDVVHGGGSEHEIYSANPNFSLPSRILLRNIFLFAFYQKLAAKGWMPDLGEDSFGFVRISGYDPLDIVVYFWDEATLLRKISTLLMQVGNGVVKAGTWEDLHLLSAVWEKMHHKEHQEFFIPSEQEVLHPVMQTLAQLYQQKFVVDGEEKSFSQMTNTHLADKIVAFLGDFRNF